MGRPFEVEDLLVGGVVSGGGGVSAAVGGGGVEMGAELLDEMS